MRKHQKRWVALLGTVAISTGGLGALPATAAADDKEPRSLSWPVVKQGATSYSIDGYAIGYLPPGLSDYSVNAASSTDRRGDGESQVSWVQAPDQQYGSVAIVRSERLQELDDLRESRYSHLSESSLEHLEDHEAFENGAYLSEGTGDLFWLDRPGVAVTTHLQPERWDSDELVQLAESVTEEGADRAEGDEPAEPVGAEAGAPGEEAAEETGAEDQEEPGDGAADGDGAAGTEQDEDVAPELPVEEAEEAEDTAPGDGGEEPGSEDTESTEETDSEEPGSEDAEGTEETDSEEPDSQDTESTEETDSEEPDSQDTEGSADPAEADLPEGVSSRAVKDCLIGRFVDFDNGEAHLDELSQESDEFIEQALTADQLSGSDRDRLLATVWYHGDENDKVAAADECAQRFDLERSEVEDVVAEVSDLIAEMVDEADQETTDGTEGPDGADAPEDEALEEEAPTDAAPEGPTVDPAGAGERGEL